MHDASTIVCNHVFKRERPIGLLVHHADRTWSAMCGAHDHEEAAEEFKVIHLGHVFEWHPEFEELAARLAPGQMADKADNGWEISFHDD
jgi:hypothetical protein